MPAASVNPWGVDITAVIQVFIVNYIILGTQ